MTKQKDLKKWQLIGSVRASNTDCSSIQEGFQFFDTHEDQQDNEDDDVMVEQQDVDVNKEDNAYDDTCDVVTNQTQDTYIKRGSQLEEEFFNSMPDLYKDRITLNLQPKTDSGCCIIEFDGIYVHNNEVISFEIKGPNKRAQQSPNYQVALIKQGTRQRKFLEKMYGPEYRVQVIMCFSYIDDVNLTPFNEAFIRKLAKEHILVAYGFDPIDTVQHAIKKLQYHGFLTE